MSASASASAPFTIDARPLQPNSTIVGIRFHTTVVPERIGLHLAFVLDVSGSMEGDRLTSLQRTLHLLIEDLQESDCLTLVTYNSTGHLLCSACSDKAVLRSHVESLRAEGGTNMGEGILTLSSASSASSVGVEPAAVFLLTDGHVNIGIRTAVGLRDLLQRALPPSIPVFTVGYGEDHDANILQALAVLRRGSYTCATSDEMIPAVVGDILGAVTTRVVKDVHVCAKSGSADFLDLGAEKGSRDFFVGSLHTDKEQWVVLDADVEAQKTISVRWSGEANKAPIHVQAVGEYQADIAQQWFRVRVVAALQEAQASLGYATHIARLVSLEAEMERSPVSREPLILTLQARIKEMLEILEKPRHRHERGFMLAGAGGAAAADLTRLVSNITTLGTQRGILATQTLLAPEATLFQSPTQRHASSQLVTRFSQATTE